jgi:hypothetical protein
MTDPYGPPDPAGNQPTQPFWVGPGPHAGSAGPDPATPPSAGPHPATPPSAGPHPATPPHYAWGEQAGAAGVGPAAGQVPSFGDHLKRDRRKALHWTLGLVAAALLAVGGTIAGLSLAGHASSLGNESPPSAQQGAMLNSALSNAGSPGTLTTALGATAMSGASTPNGTQAGAGGPGMAGTLCARARAVARAAGQAGLPRLARRIALGAARCQLARHRVLEFFLLRGVDGQFTIQTAQGIKTLAYERGVIQSVDAGKSFVVQAADGTTWTWNLVTTTVIRDWQGEVSPGNLVAGTPVWVGGPVVQNAKDARLVVLRPPQPAAASPSPTPGS